MVPERTLLLVDSDQCYRDAVRTAFEQYGYTVKCARGGVQALELLESREGAAVQMTILALELGDIDGGATAVRIHAFRSDIRVFIMSEFVDEVMVDDGLGGPPIEFLRKPPSPADLVVSVGRILAGGVC
ncbi:response regulator [Termitidicoccus mucosus]|uniref:Response regulatory domain-containing protein n=1 Tax=Termitidicoccus mucosus TaxID=1184151 RepID=A0A178IKB2_9BACT|nr:hypothetical protein AW736_00740 [Opitutaceae bacterium TSB47]